MNLPLADEMLAPWIDRGEVPGLSYAVVRAGRVVARNCLGWADREQGERMTAGHLHRVFSNTKLLTSCAVLQLVERGRLGLDDPVGEYLPALASLRALRPGSVSLSDTEPAQPVRVRHLLTHTAGFTYAFLGQPPLAQAYAVSRISDPTLDLAGMVEALGRLPLLFQPGTAWNYSVSTDVLGRLIEVIGGQRLDHWFRRHLLDPLDLRETYFHIPPSEQDRLAVLYEADPGGAPPGGGLRLRRADQVPYAGAYLQPPARLNAGGGLVSSLDDFARLLGALQTGEAALLKPQALPWVMDNQLAPGQWIGFPDMPDMRGRGHSFAGSVTVQPAAWDPAGEVGDLQWGGLAGTRWLISPARSLAIVLMTQRFRVDDARLWRTLREAVAQSFQ